MSLALFKTVLDTFGSTIIVPIIVFIISVILQVKPKTAFKGAIQMGVGLVAFNIILAALTSSFGDQITNMVNNTGINLPGIDVGWAAGAVIVYSNTIGMLYLILGLGIQLVLFVVKWTDTFQPTDIWNYYQFVFWAAIVQYMTGSFALAIGCAVFLNLVVLLLADLVAPSMQEYYGYEGVTTTCFCAINAAPFAILMKWVFHKIGLDKIQVDPEKLRGKLGFWGEPMVMGLLVGSIITIIANYNALDKMATWATIITVGLTTGAIMALYPSVAGFFVRGLTPISQTMQMRIHKGEIKRENFFISLDPAVFFGESANLTSGLLLIPIMILISIVEPGNKMLPLADLAAMPFMLESITAVMRGNILTTVITGAIWYAFGQLTNSTILNIFSQAAAVGGYKASGSSLISSWSLGVVPWGWMGYKAFVGGAVGIIIAVAIYFVVYFLFRKNKRAWQMAAGASKAYMDAHDASKMTTEADA
jgi:PTS system galactitol-specific IIC component